MSDQTSNNSIANNKRIAKNTLFLYARTMITMVITLFTSRVVLQVLGVDDYGIYNVVGGFVAMFSIISGALTASISRYLTFELGKADTNEQQLNKIFSTSLNIQIFIALFIALLGEFFGIWYINTHMNLPEGRVFAANWVLHFSLIAFAINLISIPYNSSIISHEKMSAFAYVSILDVSLKLIIVYLLYISPIDKLISYSALMVCVSIIIQSVYSIYCNRCFKECKYHFYFDKPLIKEMTNFAGLTFFTNGAMLFNTQGVNLLINNFFGVAVNAARGIALQMESAIMRFASDFTTAINPQITKSYAAGDLNSMYKLVCRGAKFSFYLFLCLALPFLFETPIILKIWLNIVPEHTVNMFRLSIIGTMFTLIGNTGYTACMATGKIKNYVAIITSLGCLVFPATWILFELGAPVESTYIIYILVYIVVDFARLWIMKGLIGFPPKMFIKSVFGNMLLVGGTSIILPLILVNLFEPGILRLISSIAFCEISAMTAIYFLGLENVERNFIKAKVIYIVKSKIHR